MTPLRTRSGSPRGATLTLAVALGGALLLADAAAAQQPGAGATVMLTGVVRDAAAGSGVGAAFLQLGESGPRAIADSTGAFRMGGVHPGPHRLTVQRFGYLPLEVDVTVADPPEPLELRMEVDPVALQGLTVTSGARIALGGSVVDDRTGEPVPWASVSLTPDAVREEASASADDRGLFRLPERPTGSYLLLVERLGYESQYVAVGLTAPSQPVEVRLRPDSVLMAGIESFDRRRRSRRNESPFQVRTYDEDALRHSLAHGMRQFLQRHASFVPCQRAEALGALCMSVQGALVVPAVRVDELISDMFHLDSYNPDELYAVEVFRCGRSVRVHAYTYAFIERMGRRPRGMLSACVG